MDDRLASYRAASTSHLPAESFPVDAADDGAAHVQTDHMQADQVPAASRHGRMIVVSNRVAMPGSTQTGGLAQAMRALLAERGGLWVGWSGQLSEDCSRHEVADGRMRLLTVDLPEREFQAYYGAFANSALWPLLHGRADLVRYEESALDGYLAVNRRFAELLAGTVRADDTIWVHDYHLLPLASLLRARGVRCRIGFFLHVPVPPARELTLLPRHRELIGALASYDLVGVQTAPDAAALAGYLCGELGAAVAGSDGSLVLPDGRRTRVAAFPIGIDPGAIAEEARQAADCATALRGSLGERALLIGVDRLDYSKGIPQRIRAFGELLERQPQWLGRATLLQITPESRAELDHYRQLGEEVQQLVGRVNGRHGDATWTPIRYVNRPYPHAQLSAFHRLARVGVVTPLRDGMNLVAKEYIAAQDPDDPGVLVLSQFAGAAQELDSALIVNPLDSARMAEALHRALTMPLAERRLRWRTAMDQLESHPLALWRDRFLAALALAGGSGASELRAPATGTLPLRQAVARTLAAAQAAPLAGVREARPGVSA